MVVHENIKPYFLNDNEHIGKWKVEEDKLSWRNHHTYVEEQIRWYRCECHLQFFYVDVYVLLLGGGATGDTRKKINTGTYGL